MSVLAREEASSAAGTSRGSAENLTEDDPIFGEPLNVRGPRGVTVWLYVLTCIVRMYV